MTGEALTVATDGACPGNPGPAGWAWVSEDGRYESGGEPHGTNQVAELSAVLAALRAFPDTPLIVQSDSAYAIGCCTAWKGSWQRRDYIKADGNPVQNLDVIRPIHQLIDARIARGYGITFVKVKGHDTRGRFPLNEAADRQAVFAAAAARRADHEVSFVGTTSVSGGADAFAGETRESGGAGSVDTTKSPRQAALDAVASVLVALDHTDDWNRGFGATPDDLQRWERTALYAAAGEVIDVLEAVRP